MRIDENPGDDGGEGDAHVSPDTVHRERHAGPLRARLDHHGDPDRVIDGREHADEEQTDANLQRCSREAGEDRADADAGEEHRHHALAAPAVGQPAGGQGKGAEGDEARRRVDDELRVAEPEYRRQREGRYRRVYEDEQVVVEVAQVQEQELQTAGARHAHFSQVPRSYSLRDGATGSFRQYVKKYRETAKLPAGAVAPPACAGGPRATRGAD